MLVLAERAWSTSPTRSSPSGAAGVLVETSTRWELTEPAGGGDAHRAHLRGTRADIHVEQSAATGWRRRLVVKPHARRHRRRGRAAAVRGGVAGEAAGARRHARRRTAGSCRSRTRSGRRTSRSSRASLDEFLGYVERGEWPARRVADTLAKYELLAQARGLAERG